MDISYIYIWIYLIYHIYIWVYLIYLISIYMDISYIYDIYVAQCVCLEYLYIFYFKISFSSDEFFSGKLK